MIVVFPEPFDPTISVTGFANSMISMFSWSKDRMPWMPTFDMVVMAVPHTNHPPKPAAVILMRSPMSQLAMRIVTVWGRPAPRRPVDGPGAGWGWTGGFGSPAADWRAGRVLSGGANGQLILWDLASGRE